MFVLNMAFVSSGDVENIYIPRMKYTYISFHE